MKLVLFEKPGADDVGADSTNPEAIKRNRPKASG